MPRNNDPINMEEYRKKRDSQRKPPSQDVFSYLIIAGIFVVILIYIGHAIISYVDSPEISIGTISMGSIETPEILYGIIIRNERVYTSNAAGTLTFNSAEGERVRRGSIVGAIVDPQTEAVLTQSLAEVESQIFNMQNMRADLILSSHEVEQKNLQIRRFVDAGVPRLMTAGISAVYELRDNISHTIDQRNQIILTEGHGRAENLVGNRETFNERLQNAQYVLRAERSGIVSHWVDGLEGTFTFETMDNLMPEQIRFSSDFSRIGSSQIVEPGDSLFKIVESNEWYIAAFIPNDNILNWLPGSDRTIYIESAFQEDVFIPIEMRITRLVSGETNSYVLLRSNKFMIDYLNTRNIRFKTSRDEHSGFRIPRSAIVDRTVLRVPTDHILINESGYFVMRRANGVDSLVAVGISSVFDPDEPFVYIQQDFDGLRLGDTIVRSGDSPEIHQVTDVDNIRGLFTVNRGYTQFFQVHIDENTRERGGYYIIDPSLNAGLRIFDRIILDARNVRERQIVN
ncbi:MAG: hypothetical protein FWE29_01155 [Defluviitaleaceae bacterium]|nr:hypothetical protein [Defluviitaleaceae bacterium]